MRQELTSLTARTSLTRISVSGNGQFYTVRNGGEDPVRVWMRGDGLRCECGRANCAHIATLQMCGFVELPSEERIAA
jgi:hypothetical protein